MSIVRLYRYSEKIHPQFINQLPHYGDQYSDSVIYNTTNKFEELIEQVDLIFLDTTSSTTFYTSFKTNKPMILANVEAENFFANSSSALQRQCALLKHEDILLENSLLVDKMDELIAIARLLNDNYFSRHYLGLVS